MIDIQIGFNNTAFHAAADLAQINGRLKSFREPLNRSIREVCIPRIKENFEVGGDPAWEPLALGTLLQKATLGYPEDILLRTGTLEREAGQVRDWEVTRDTARYTGPRNTIAVSRSRGRFNYSGIHQFGAGDIPARPWVTMPEEDEQAIEDIFAEWLNEVCARYGF